jgi:hypothetical protein
MITHIIVTEGLSRKEDGSKNSCCLSDYFQAVLDRVLEVAPIDENIFLSPGNSFGFDHPEEEYALQYLLSIQPNRKVFMPSGIRDRKYLDTFDNARLLRLWMQKQGLWPVGNSIIYCNGPHSFRSGLIFRLCGFKVRQVIGCGPLQKKHKMVPRLWFYDNLIFHVIYEILSTVYIFIRWSFWRFSGNRY